jgi:predicted aspartyl protease
VNDLTSVETIPFTYNNLPSVNVKINGKIYKFLVDTGAPTLISNAIFNDLQLKPQMVSTVKDSEGVVSNQNFIIVPSIKLGSLEYKNVGVVVSDLKDAFEIGCKGFDGILSAYQMAISVWKFDYSKKEIQIARSISSFDLKDFKTIDFMLQRPQMTPLVQVNVLDTTKIVTYDTGFTGSLELVLATGNENLSFVKNSGISSAGFNGTGISRTRK